MIKKNEMENVVTDIASGIRNNMEIATLGLSGGADSTLCACLCVLALGKENVYGYGMPYGLTDLSTFNDRSMKLAEMLDVNYQELTVRRSVDAVSLEISGRGEHKISELNEGNLRSRMRMIYLYTLNCANAEKYGKAARVIGTGNMSEDFIGYDTKGGDALADIFPIGELYKSEVYQMLDYFVEIGMIEADMIDRNPSAGLWEGQSDADEIGHTYDEMEPAVRFCRENYHMMKALLLSDSELLTPMVRFVWNRHVVNKHKHMAPPTITIDKERFEING